MERAAMYEFGPRFFADGGETMFEFRVDAGNVIGPRPAKPDDMKKHAKAWDAFISAKSGEAPPEPEPIADAPRRRGRPPKA